MIVDIELSMQRERFGLIKKDLHACGLFREGVQHVDVHDLFYGGEEDFGGGSVVAGGDRAVRCL